MIGRNLTVPALAPPSATTGLTGCRVTQTKASDAMA
jgi:hypothetical protein